MRYMVLIYGSEAVGAAKSEAEQQAEMGEYFAFNTMTQERGAYLAGEALFPVSSATTVRVREGKVLTTDGPFAETKEQLGGFYMLECKNVDEAIELVAQIPGARTGSIEIRPIVEFS